MNKMKLFLAEYSNMVYTFIQHASIVYLFYLILGYYCSAHEIYLKIHPPLWTWRGWIKHWIVPLVFICNNYAVLYTKCIFTYWQFYIISMCLKHITYTMSMKIKFWQQTGTVSYNDRQCHINIPYFLVRPPTGRGRHQVRPKIEK